MSKLRRPEQIKDWLVRRYDNQHRAWLEGFGEWPLKVMLGVPTEADVAADLTGVRAWVDAWSAWSGTGRLESEERRWVRLGNQTLPVALVLAGPEEVAAWCGQERRWTSAFFRRGILLQRWPQLGERLGFGRFFDMLADYSEADFERLLAVLCWLLANPDSALYIRQLPVASVDTKWIQRRTGLIAELLGLLRGGNAAADFYAATGLRRMLHRVRIRVLCPELRRCVGGLRDIEAPTEELAALAVRPSALLVVENHESGVALPDMPGVIAFVGLGKAVTALATLPWVRSVPAVYWGDIDTHGLAILSAARATLPGIKSVLMDIETLLRFKELAVQEPAQASEASLSELTASERQLFDNLRAGTWGTRLRLEQERLPWDYAIDTVCRATLSGAQI